MSKHVAFLISASSILLYIDGREYVVGNDHPNFTKIKDAIAAKKFDSIAALADVAQSVRNWLTGDQDFELKGDRIHLNGVAFSSEITDKVLNMIEAGHNADPLYKFLRKVRTNPSATAQAELLLFCVANGFMIHEDGDILAYKSVRNDYLDIHSGRVLNKPASMLTLAERQSMPRTVNGVTVTLENGVSVVKMERGQVDDNRSRTCSVGLHFASHNYATTWHGRSDAHLLVMKINPRDVVSIPEDYHNEKGRTCRYEVIAEIPHSDRLPKREVYSQADLSGSTARAQAEKLAATVARKAKLTASRTRKEAVIDGYDDELSDLNDRIGQIEDLGGDASDLLNEVARIERAVDIVNEEIDAIDDEIATL